MIFMQYAPSSYGQLHINYNAPSQYQSTSQMHAPNMSSGRQLGLSSESQSTASVTSLQHTVGQPSVPTAVASVRRFYFSPLNTYLPSSSTSWSNHFCYFAISNAIHLVS